MADASLDEISQQLAALPEGAFLKVVRQALAARVDELDQHYFQSRYALAVISGYPAAPRPVDWTIEFVAEPTGAIVGDGSYRQQGTCLRCGFEAICEAKLASCGVCGGDVGLT